MALYTHYEVMRYNVNMSHSDMLGDACRLKVSVDAIVEREIQKPDDLEELAGLIIEEAKALASNMREHAIDIRAFDAAAKGV
jgi:hypothetical protein